MTVIRVEEQAEGRRDKSKCTRAETGGFTALLTASFSPLIGQWGPLASLMCVWAQDMVDPSRLQSLKQPRQLSSLRTSKPATPISPLAIWRHDCGEIVDMWDVPWCVFLRMPLKGASRNQNIGKLGIHDRFYIREHTSQHILDEGYQFEEILLHATPSVWSFA